MRSESQDSMHSASPDQALDPHPASSDRRRPTLPNHRTPWYVVQVSTGREDQTCALIERMARELDEIRQAQSDVDGPVPPLLEECFCPRFRTRHKRMGRWVDVEHALMPGYVVVATSDPAGLQRVLHRMPRFARMIKSAETYVPLSAEDRAWLDEQTHRDDRVVPISVAYKVGDKLVVTEGPLQGREAMVTRVNRQKCLAHLELHVGQLTIHTTVGLAVLPGPKED